jgi:hypothetical protein
MIAHGGILRDLNFRCGRATLAVSTRLAYQKHDQPPRRPRHCSKHSRQHMRLWRLRQTNGLSHYDSQFLCIVLLIINGQAWGFDAEHLFPHALSVLSVAAVVQQPHSFVSLPELPDPSPLLILQIGMFISILQHTLRVSHSSFPRYNLLRRSPPSLVHSSCSKSPIMRWKHCGGHP